MVGVTLDIWFWIVEGTLIAARKDLMMKAEAVIVNGNGKFQIGTKDSSEFRAPHRAYREYI